MEIKYADLEITGEEFNDIIQNGHKLVVVDFFAEWCMPCVIMSPIIEDLSKEMKDVKFVKLNVDDNSKISGKYKVLSIPTLIIFKDGKEVGRIVGSHSEYVIEERIKKFLD